MSYGFIVNLPNGLVIDNNTYPFALADIIDLSTSSPSGSKTYTNFVGRTIRYSQVYADLDWSKALVPSSLPTGHTLSVTNNGVSGIAPTLNWSTSLPPNCSLCSSTIYVVII